jgi:L-iditol 2-dehydrogenase
VAFVGECGDETPLKISQDMIRKGITLVGSWHYNLKDVPKLMQVVMNNAEKLDKFITHQFALDDVQRAWEIQVTGECAKVILKPWGE